MNKRILEETKEENQRLLNLSLYKSDSLEQYAAVGISKFIIFLKVQIKKMMEKISLLKLQSFLMLI